MSWLIGVLVALCYCVIVLFVLAGAIVLSLDWLSMPGQWRDFGRSPAELDDYDAGCDGWWCEDVHELQEPPWSGPGIKPDGFAYRWHPSGEIRLQFLLPAEQIDAPWPKVWHLIHGAQL